MTKLYAVSGYEKKDAKGNPMQITVVAPRQKVLYCKNCKKQPRAGTSLRCAECLKAFKIQTYNRKRLSLKVEQAQTEQERKL